MTHAKNKGILSCVLTVGNVIGGDIFQDPSMI